MNMEMGVCLCATVLSLRPLLCSTGARAALCCTRYWEPLVEVMPFATIVYGVSLKPTVPCSFCLIALCKEPSHTTFVHWVVVFRGQANALNAPLRRPKTALIGLDSNTDHHAHTLGTQIPRLHSIVEESR